MMPARRRLLAAVALVASGAGAQAGGTLTYCTAASPEGFDPAQYMANTTDDASGIPLYDQLLEMKPGTTEIQPGAARSWEISADGLSYTLHLRPGVKFHATPWFTPTREMDADDVVWSLQRLNDPHHPAHAMAPDGYRNWASTNMTARIQAIARLDPMTVRITLARPDASFLAELTVPTLASVMSAEYAGRLEKAGKLAQMNVQPVGTGPFVFRSYQKDAVVRYAANTAYWGGTPKLDALIFAVTVDPAVRAQRVKAGECLVAQIAGDQVQAMESDPHVGVVHTHPLSNDFVWPNTQHPFLSDPRFRAALSLAIDRATLVKAVYNGLGEPAGSVLPAGIWSFDPTIANPHDPARARALVKASGYDGRELTLFHPAGSGKLRQQAELLQSDWAAVGIRVRPQPMEFGELMQRTAKGDHDLALASDSGDDGDPDDYLDAILACAGVAGGSNASRYCNPELDALLAAGRATTDLKARTAAYLKVQALLHDQAPLIPLTSHFLSYAVNKRVSGFVATPFGKVDFRNASVN